MGRDLAMKINKNAPPIETSEPYYDLVQGYIKPEKMLIEGGKEVSDAIKLVIEFFDFLEAEEKIDYL